MYVRVLLLVLYIIRYCPLPHNVNYTLFKSLHLSCFFVFWYHWLLKSSTVRKLFPCWNIRDTKHFAQCSLSKYHLRHLGIRLYRISITSSCKICSTPKYVLKCYSAPQHTPGRLVRLRTPCYNVLCILWSYVRARTLSAKANYDWLMCMYEEKN